MSEVGEDKMMEDTQQTDLITKLGKLLTMNNGYKKKTFINIQLKGFLFRMMYITTAIIKTIVVIVLC